MQKETVYFSIHRDFTSEHPDIGGSWHYVGSAVVTDHEDGELPDIDIQRLYMAADPQVGCLPSTYISADPNVRGFVRSKAFEHIEMACLDLFAADSQSQESQEAEAICKHFEEREQLAKAYALKVSFQKTMTPATIPSKKEHNGFWLTTFLIPDECPDCGAKIKKITGVYSYDGSRRINCDGWDYECGHTMTYEWVRQNCNTTNYKEPNEFGQ